MILQTVKAIATSAAPLSINDAQRILANHTPTEQAQLISALYMGRNALHVENFTPDDAPYTTAAGLATYTNDIPQAHYAQILSEKGMSTIKYFQRFAICAQNAGLVV